MKKKKLSVMAIPANEHRADNPYNYILNTSLDAQGVNVSGYNLKRFLLAKDFDVLHLHWPENFLAGKTGIGALKAFAGFWTRMFYLKLRGKKIVWTVHNQAPHEAGNLQLMQLFYKWLYSHVDGFISLTNHGAEKIAEQGVLPEKIAVIPHPHYGGCYPNGISKEEARAQLDIPLDKFVFLFAGQIRPYKNVDGLVKAFRELNDDGAVLVIAGKVHPDLSSELHKWIEGSDNVLVYPRFIENEDLQLFLNSADLVVTPFNKVLNSGSVFLNLSFQKPTLVPATAGLLELQKQVGKHWIKTFAGSLTATHLQKSKAELLEQPIGSRPDLAPFEWNRIAKCTKAFYLDVLAGKRSVASEIKATKQSPVVIIAKTKSLSAS